MTDGNLPGSEQYLITYLPDTGGMIAHRIKWEQTENKADKGHWQTYGRVFIDELGLWINRKDHIMDIDERLENIELHIKAIQERLDSDLPLSPKSKTTEDHLEALVSELKGYVTSTLWTQLRDKVLAATEHLEQLKRTDGEEQ